MMNFFLPFERRNEPLAPRWLFARRLIVNVGLALSLILVSLIAGMAGYHYIEGSGWMDAFDEAAMILGGMGPYSEPKTSGGKLFAGLYALYSGLLLIGVTGLILAPLFHRVMHHFHLPDEENSKRNASKRANTSSRRRS
jgi:sterol desaturase/sphingolipid hydroxylase (fatty acid hydroxylase superfamily)